MSRPQPHKTTHTGTEHTVCIFVETEKAVPEVNCLNLSLSSLLDVKITYYNKPIVSTDKKKKKKKVQ